jgi:exodeoxyribonuclease V alpha subunit
VRSHVQMGRGADRPRPPDREGVAGSVERVTFHNPENGFCVLRVNVQGHRDLVTIVGHAAAVAAGEFVHASGQWAHDREYGRQFKAAHLRVTLPASREGIEKYLGSGLVRGVGPHYARALVARFGEAVLDIIDCEPARLREIHGIGPLRAQRIAAGWSAQKAIRQIMLFLHAHGVGTSRAVRIYRTYGADAVPLISENPYRLAREIRGVGFVTADAIARRLGIEPTALIRARAGVGYALAEAMDEGHCGLPRDELQPLAVRLLEIPLPIIEQAIVEEITAGELVSESVDGRECLFLAGLHRAERTVLAGIRRLARGPLPWRPVDCDKAMAWVEQRLGLHLAEGQLEAIRLAMRSKLLVITGGPGVGKTTLLRAVLAVHTARRTRVLLCAPTGRAARRLSESTGAEARTIHRLLEIVPTDGRFRRSEAQPLDCDVLVVDETSMVDVPLMSALLRAVPDHAAVILVGDADQLPSVGPGQVLADVLASGAVPTIRLTEIFRQAAHSRIVVNAHRINEGAMPLFGGLEEESDCYFVEAEPTDEGARKLVQIVRERIPRRFGLQPVRDVQVLCPMNRGALGARALNLELQRALNPGAGIKVDRYGWTFASGDKVMQIENNYDKEVYNGDLGFITSIDRDLSELTVDFEGRPVIYDFDELDQVVLAYAITIHKSQGSEFPAVVVPVTTQHYPLLQRNLIYTAVTRGRRLVVLVGQRKALAIAVRGRRSRRRWSKLREWLQEAADEQGNHCKMPRNAER